MERKLPERMVKELWGSLGKTHKLFFEIDEKGNFIGVRKWLRNIVSTLFAGFWILIIILKIIPCALKVY
ncbi:hypothetical protein MUO79_08955 [Candidatus Bathyarchaeota archaeon]|nr:hypothetical protein [Candidatus Bathyarchaeota archaeon]